MTIRDKLAAYQAAIAGIATELRFPVVDADALELAKSLDAPRHPTELAAGIAAVEALPERPEGDAELAEWALNRQRAYAALWDALEGEVVDGVEIIRRR